MIIYIVFQRSCKASGGYLTEIQDQEENDFIARLTFGEGKYVLADKLIARAYSFISY